jgi:hypothetical protein
MKILNGIVGVLLDPTFHCNCLCPIRHPIPLIINWMPPQKNQNANNMIPRK